jgi:uncharacterized protein (DUF1499 family)
MMVMNESAKIRKPRGTRWCGTGIVLAGTGTVLVFLGLVGARTSLLPPAPAFIIFGIGGLALLISIVSMIIGLALSKGTGGAASVVRAWSALTVAILVIAVSMSQRPASSGAPAIHDITTDVGNPPSFDALLPLRKDAPNPPEYAGGETARIQTEAYPDIVTLTVEMPTDEVFMAAEKVVRALGWEIARSDPDAGQIEATDTTYWFRFKDDVVIRMTPRGAETDVDIRSKSRVGRGDMGTNALRIRDFLNRLSAATAD